MVCNLLVIATYIYRVIWKEEDDDDDNDRRHPEETSTKADEKGRFTHLGTAPPLTTFGSSFALTEITDSRGPYKTHTLSSPLSSLETHSGSNSATSKAQNETTSIDSKGGVLHSIVIT